MPTNYVGDKTNTQSPSAAPEPDGSITVALPADGDPPNASTFNQQNKALADFVDWLMTPQAKASDYDGHIMAYRTARGTGNVRHVIDHYGYPMGKFQQFRDDLGGIGFSQSANTVNATVTYGVDYDEGVTYDALKYLRPDWVYGIYRAIPGVEIGVCGIDPDPTAIYAFRPYSNMCFMRALDSVGDCTGITRQGGQKFSFHDSVVAVLEWDACLSGYAVVDGVSVATMGLGAILTVPGDLPDWGVYFKRSASENWMCAVKASSAAAATQVDSGVAPAAGSYQRFRIAFVGANVCENTTARALFFIDGALVANVTLNLPTYTLVGYPLFGIKRNLAGGTAGQHPQLYLGMPIVGAHNVFEGAATF